MVILNDIDAAISAKDLTTRSGRLARNSLLVLRERWEPSIPPLRVELGNNKLISASELSRLTQALQDATAKIAMLIIRPSVDQVRVTKAARDRAPLIPRSQAGNVLFFDFPPNVASEGDTQLALGTIPHLAEQAVRQLIENLPETRAEDDRALTALPARRLAIRSAISTLATAVQETNSMTMTLSSHSGEPETSVLTVEQAREVPELLSGVRTESEVITVQGVMDGMRTRRRLFYLIENEAFGGREFEGSATGEQIDALQRVVGQPVVARLQRSVSERADGQRTHSTFSLLDFSVPRDFELGTLN